MEGFESDTIPSFYSSEEVDENDDSERIDDTEIEYQDIGGDDDDSVAEESSGSSSDSHESPTCSAAKRFKKAICNGKSFKSKIMQVLTQSCEVAGDFAVSGRLDRTPLVAISLKNKGGGADDECIKFPLQDHEVAKFLKYFEPPPYETIVDATVRNSFQLSPDRFEILNPEWDKYIETLLTNHIKKEMLLECSFVPKLYKLRLYQPGSFFKPHRDSEKEDNMFGTLVVQLPSKFQGGLLVVRHDGNAKLFDFSSAAMSANNSFSTFFSAFYCDCEHEILPVTEGYRLCLVYNLIATDAEIPFAPQNHALEQELIRLLQNWNGSSKIVYALTHKYSEANLSFKNLKTTDKIVANILQRASSACELNILLALFEKECTGDDSDGDFDGEDDDVSYSLQSLISDGNNERLGCSSLAVDFKKEVIPNNCFDSVSPYHQNSEHTGNEGAHVTKSYRCAAITFWPKQFTFQVLKASHASHTLTDSLFIMEAEKYFDPNCNADSKIKVLQWAQSIVTQKRYTETGVVAIVNTIIKFNDMDLIQKLIQNGVVRSPEAFGLIVTECDKYGWEHFATSTAVMFKELEQNKSVKMLTVFLGDGNMNQEKNKVFSALLQVIFDKGLASWTYYYSSMDKMKQQKDKKDMIEPLMNAVLNLNDLKLMVNFVKCILPLHSETISLLATICDTNGWEPFSTAITAKFLNKSRTDQIICLNSIIHTGVLKDDKKTLCLQLFSVLFNKHQDLTNDSLYYRHYRLTSLADTAKRRQEDKAIIEPLINAASVFKDLQLMKNIFQRMPLHSETIPLLVNQSQTFGWNAFATEIIKKFEKLSQIDAIDTLSMLIGTGNFKEEKSLCFNLFQMVLGKIHMPADQSKYLKEKQDILYSICCVAENHQFDLIPFAKTKSFKEFVPVLLRLVQKETNRLPLFWAPFGMHFINEIGRESIKPIEDSWRHSSNLLTACCNDCRSLNNFLESDKERESFKMGKNRRKHLQQGIVPMAKLSHRTESGGRGQMGVLVVTKTEMGSADALRDKTLSKALLERLRVVMPYN